MEVTVGEKKYFIGKIEVFTQFKIAKRLFPLLPALSRMRETSAETIEDLVASICSLDDETLDFISYECLRVVERDVPGARPSRVMNEHVNKGVSLSSCLQFQDIGPLEIIALVKAVIEHNISGFSGGLVNFSALQAGAAPSSPST